MGVHEGSRNAIVGKRMGQQVIAPAVNRLLRDDMAAVCRQRLDGIGDGSRPEASASAAEPPSSAASLFSRTSCVEFVRRP